MIVSYEAVDRSGRTVTDSIEAADVRAAVDALRKHDLFVTRVTSQTTGPASGPLAGASPALAGAAAGGASMAIGGQMGTPAMETTSAGGDAPDGKLSAKQLTFFTRQLAMLLNAGSALVPALQSISRQFTKPAQIKMIKQICGDLEEGLTLTESLRKFPQTFDCTYCAIVASGEASASLGGVFTRLAAIVGKRRAMRNKLIGALAYPVLLIGLSSAINLVLLFFVLPRFGGMFETMGVPLPGSTAVLLKAGGFAERNWLLASLGTLALGGGCVAFVLSNRGKNLISDALTHVPIVKRLANGLVQGETFRVMGMLIEARVGLMETIDLVRGVTRNRRYQALYDAIHNEVSSGGSISDALESSGIVSPAYCQAVRTGEQSGQLGEAMSYIADVLDEENTELLGTVTKLFEPSILIVMGLMVGGVAISLFMPLFDMTSVVG